MNRFPRTVIVLFVMLLSLLPLARVAATPYLTEADVPLVSLLPPPPKVGSDEQKADLAAVVAAQAARTPASSQRASDDSTRSVLRFSDALGHDFGSHEIPLTRALFKELAHETEDLTDAAKHVFQRNRPFVDDPELRPILVTPTDGSRPTGQSPSYPSGHSTFGWATGILLAQMVPERVDAIFSRSEEFAHNRLVAGVHYPSDIEAGRICGTVIVNALEHSPKFQADFEAAKVELRAALGLN